jgi:MoxR-like ATPase
MSEFITPVERQRYYQEGLEQLDHLLIGEKEAKIGTLITMLTGANIVLVGEPGGGKTTLAENSYRLVGGIEPEDVATVPPLSDLPPQQLVGGQTKVTKTITKERDFTIDEPGGTTTETTSVDIDAIVKPTSKVIFANEINRVAPHAVNAMLEALESGTLVTTAGSVPMDQLEYGVSTMNPSESWQATFRMAAAIASRHALGVVLGSTDKNGNRDKIIYDVLGGWVPRPDKITPVTDTTKLRAMREQSRDGVAIPEPLKKVGVEKIKQITDSLKQIAGIDEADARLARQVSEIAKALAYVGGQDAITEMDLRQALRFPIVARLGILGVKSTKADVYAVADQITGDL